MEDQDHILSLKQKASLAKLGVVLCYLHGSVALDQARNDSDVDIAVLFEQLPEDSVKATTAIVTALHGFVPEHEMDIAILNNASPLLAQSVVVNGKLLYARSSGDDLLFQIRVMHDYESSLRIVHIGQKMALARAQV
jgi:predicted nucleotidyltransferase